jgi:hypothetical protein
MILFSFIIIASLLSSQSVMTLGIATTNSATTNINLISNEQGANYLRTIFSPFYSLTNSFIDSCVSFNMSKIPKSISFLIFVSSYLNCYTSSFFILTKIQVTLIHL